MVRGEIFFVDLAPRSGSEQAGRRPCILVSHDAFTDHAGWRSVTVVPLTTSSKWLQTSPTTVVFEAGESGVPKRCAALAHQITTIDKKKLLHPALGRLDPEKAAALGAAIRNYLDLV